MWNPGLFTVSQKHTTSDACEREREREEERVEEEGTRTKEKRPEGEER